MLCSAWCQAADVEDVGVRRDGENGTCCHEDDQPALGVRHIETGSDVRTLVSQHLSGGIQVALSIDDNSGAPSSRRGSLKPRRVASASLHGSARGCRAGRSAGQHGRMSRQGAKNPSHARDWPSRAHCDDAPHVAGLGKTSTRSTDRPSCILPSFIVPSPSDFAGDWARFPHPSQLTDDHAMGRSRTGQAN